MLGLLLCLWSCCFLLCWFFFFQADGGIRDLVRSRGLGDVYVRQGIVFSSIPALSVSVSCVSVSVADVSGVVVSGVLCLGVLVSGVLVSSGFHVLRSRYTVSWWLMAGVLVFCYVLSVVLVSFCQCRWFWWFVCLVCCCLS